MLDCSDLGGQGGLLVRPRKIRSANSTYLLTAVLLIVLSAYAQTNRPASAEQKPITGAASGSQDSLDLVTEAEAFYRQGHLDEAAQRYQQLLQVQPKSAEAYAGLSRVFLKQKKAQQARDTISEGLAVVDSAPIRVALGEVLFREGKLAEAESEWLSVVNSGHTNARAHLGLARVSKAATQYKQAKTEIDKARALDPSDPDIELYWVSFLRPSEQVLYLENYLSHESGANAEEQAHLRNHLELLKARLKDSTHSCRLVSELTSTGADLLRVTGERPNQIRGYNLAVALNGQNSKLQLDTGASGILIDRQIAQKAGLTKLSDTTIGGFGDRGEGAGYFAMASSIKIGELEFRDCPVVVLDKRSVLGEDGLIGTDVFQEFLIDLDFRNKKLRLGKLPKRPDEDLGKVSLRTDAGETDPLEAESRTDATTTTINATTAPPYMSLTKRFVPAEFSFSFTPVFRFGHALLIPTEIGDIQATRLFEIDTGSNKSILSVNVAREIMKVRVNSRMAFKGLSGSVKNVYPIEHTNLRFDHVQLYADNQIAIDLAHLSESTGTEVSGVLGVFAFVSSDVTIDYRDGLVAFDKPNP